MLKGLYFSKIGAKITEYVQPLDLGLFVKLWSIQAVTVPLYTRQLWSLCVSTLSLTSYTKTRQLCWKKLNQKHDCAATSPEIFAKSFKTDTIQHVFVDAGMLDVRPKLYPDIDVIVSAFKINWTKVQGGKAWFYPHITAALKKMYLMGQHRKIWIFRQLLI